MISISQRRETVTVFVGTRSSPARPDRRRAGEGEPGAGGARDVPQRLEQVLTRLTALEFQNAVVLDDVLVVLQRAEMAARMLREVERDCVELGTEGRLIRAQLEELADPRPRGRGGGRRRLPRERRCSGRPSRALERLGGLPYRRPARDGRLQEVLGFPRIGDPLDTAVSPRGYRALSQLPRLPPAVIRRSSRSSRVSTPSHARPCAIWRAVDGVGSVRAREIQEGLRRLQEHNLVERYLTL